MATMDVHSLKPPLLLTHRRRALLAASVATCAAFTGGLLVGAAFFEFAPHVEHILVRAPEVTVAVPPIQLPAPAVSGQMPAAVELALTASEPPEQSRPRPLAPRLWAQCVDTYDDVPEVCQWDDGFPAIAASGKLVATKYIPDDSGRGYPGLSLRLLDATTGRVVRTIVVLSPDEYVEDTETTTAEVTKLWKKVSARVTAAQRLLDAGGYRTMDFIGNAFPLEESEGAPTDPEPMPTQDTIYAEIDSSAAVRIVDPATNTAIFQHQFDVAEPARLSDNDGMCGGWQLREMSLWWDKATRVVVSSQDYKTGGCMCADETVEQIAHVPPPA